MAKAMIKNVRLSYVRLFEAQQVNGQGEASYSVCLLIPKDSPEVPKIKAAIEAEFSTLKARYPKLNGKDPKVWTNPLRDGDAEKDGAEYQGCYFINAKRKEKQAQAYRDWETDRKSTRLNSSHRSLSRMPSSA